MLVNFSNVQNIFMVCGHTDMRCGIDGLASIITDKYNLNLFNDALSLFCGRKKDRFKALYWDKYGFILLYKRIEKGNLQWPRNQEEVKKLTNQELRWLLEGLSIQQPKPIKPAQTGCLI